MTTEAKTRDEILAALKWSEPRKVNTRNGLKLCKSAPANDEVFDLLNREPDEMRKLGFSIGKWKGEWQLTQWSEVPAEVVAAERAAIESSRATDAAVEIPKPDGLEFMPFQKAGIAYALARPSVLIADEPGLGKTLQAIGIMNADASLKRIMVVVPASLKLNWKRECDKWLIGISDITIVSSKERDVAKRLLGALALNNQERDNGFKNGLNIPSAPDGPSKLVLLASNSEVSISSESSSNAKIKKSPKGAEPFNEGLVCRINAYPPTRPTTNEGESNRPLAVDNTSKVSSVREPSGTDKRFSDSISSDGAVRESAMVKVIVKGIGVNPNLLSKGSDASFSSVNGGDNAVENGLGNYNFARHIVIVNYDILHLFQEELHSILWDLVVLDEAHYLKGGATTRRGRMVFGKKATKKDKAAGKTDFPAIRARRRVLLTGTPIANRPVELFPLIEYLDPATWGGKFFKYATRYCAAHRNAFGWDFSGASNLDELQNRLRATLMVRRLKKDVLTELPAKRRAVVEFAAEGKLAQFAEAEREAYEDREDEIADLHAAVELAKASDNPDEYVRAVENLRKGIAAIFAAISTMRMELAIAKLPLMIDFLRDAIEESGKIVFMAHHKAVVNQIQKEFGAAAVSLVGDTSMEDRQAAVDRFQKDPTCTLFIGSIIAAGVGITLTAASRIIFGELDWVPGNVTQAEDRIHRIGQKESVLVQHLVVEGSLDATIAKRLIAKQSVIDAALDTVRAKIEGEPVESHHRSKVEGATAGTTRDQLAKEAESMTADQRAAVLEGLKFMSARDTDGARHQNELGFSGTDTRIGNDLAGRPFLSAKQAALGRKILKKYRNTQLPEALVARLNKNS